MIRRGIRGDGDRARGMEGRFAGGSGVEWGMTNAGAEGNGEDE